MPAPFAALSTVSTGYRLLLLAHILCVIVGFGSTFVYPFLGAQAEKRKGVAGAAISDSVESTAKIVTTPFIYAAGFFGFVLVAVGPDDFSARWVQLAILVFAVAVLFAAAVHVPNLKKLNELAQQMAAGPPPGAAASGPPPQVAEMESRGKAAARNGGILTLLFLVLLVLMIWKPL